MNYKIKYNEALERAQKMQENSNGMILKKWLWSVFPELKEKESEDEKIKREIVAYINELADIKNEKIPTKWIAWLEKQGENKDLIGEIKNRKALLGAEKEKAISSTDKLSFGARIAMLDELLAWVKKEDEKKSNSQMEKRIDCQFVYTGYCDGTCILENNEQKPVDKIEPKFEPGDWISNGRYVKKIIDINSDWPHYIFQDGTSKRIKDIDAKWYIMPNMDELEWIDMETNENHCYSCELFDRNNEMCKCVTLCKNYRNTYKGFYIR